MEGDTDNDLELQLPAGHLTPKERVVNVLNSVFPFKQTYERINNGFDYRANASKRAGKVHRSGNRWDSVFFLMAIQSAEGGR